MQKRLQPARKKTNTIIGVRTRGARGAFPPAALIVVGGAYFVSFYNFSCSVRLFLTLYRFLNRFFNNNFTAQIIT